tara:strand:- start:481 stop:1365 length:885 start_codon:yes stop_codon:yes gene_type:complete
MNLKIRKRHLNSVSGALLILGLSCTASVFGGEGKIIATAGLTQIEGSGGGGLVPWATLSGYDSRDEISVGAFNTQVNVDDFRLQSWGVNASFYDRLEVSLAQQTFDLKPASGNIRQNIIGLKARLYGDVVYSQWPQVSLGVQHKRLIDQNTDLSPTTADAVGADKSDHGTDFYLAMTKVHLGLICGYNFVWNLNFRATKANEMGLLGFGGSKNKSYEIMTEASAGILLNEHVAVGLEYRQKPDNLGLKEDDWKDAFISYIPNKNMSLTLAWAELGTIAGAKDQNGWYVSLNANL